MSPNRAYPPVMVLGKLTAILHVLGIYTGTHSCAEVFPLPQVPQDGPEYRSEVRHCPTKSTFFFLNSQDFYLASEDPSKVHQEF